MVGLESGVYHGLRLLTRCGSGAYGSVYYCEDVTGRHLAVKIVSKSQLGEEWQRELRGVANFRRITDTSGRLLRIFHVEKTDDGFYYTMEAADPLPDAKEHCPDAKEYRPDTLAARLRKGPLPEAERFEVLYAIFDGIAAIHRAGLAHRDIKPDNILFVNGAPKLGDIGLVSSLSSATTNLAGTLEFMPPEVRAADGVSSGELRQKSDLYAFGKVIYCAITGLSASNYPTIPKGFERSLSLKLLMQLSLQMCRRNSLCRLETLEKVDSELLRIRHLLLYGETFRDKLAYFFKHVFSEARNAVLPAFFRWRRKLAAALLLLLCAVGVNGTVERWRFHPPPSDITKVRTKEYRSEEKGISMTIPVEWEVMYPETVLQRLSQLSDEDIGELTEEQRKLLQETRFEAELGIDTIFCNTSEEQSVVITVGMAPLNGEDILAMGDDEIRVSMLQFTRDLFGEKTYILSMERTAIAGKPCIIIDIIQPSHERRMHYCLFPLQGKSAGITLHSPQGVFDKYLEQFNEALLSLKFL